MRHWSVLFGLCGVLLCQHTDWVRADETPPAAAEVEFFEQKIRPLLVNRCHECHAAGAKSIKGGLRVDGRAGLLAGGDSGPALVPHKPDESLLIKAVLYKQDSVQMPPRGRLPQREIDLLVEWVRRGAVFPETAVTDVTKHGGGIDLAAGRQFWSFQPVREQPLPPLKNASWAKRRIDAFVLQKQTENKLQPSPTADRRTLLRRLSFDLIGLPPTLDELKAFEADTSTDAYAQQVERLLASPHYGEKWGRFWLDLVRYCDVPESWAIDKHAKAWLYRDWVVSALNQDISFDRFLELQFAADLLDDTAPADVAALGLLGLSPTYWKELKLDPGVIKSVVAEEWEERIHTVSGAVLGLTVACARCHDHKQDPIGMDDYYALAGVFASTKQAPRSILPDADAQIAAETRAKIDEWSKQRSELLGKKPKPSDEEKQQAETLAKQIAELERATPQLQVPLAYAVEDASLHVLPDGPNRTKLEYAAGEPQNVAMQVRGSPTRLGPVVPRRFISVLCDEAPAPFQQGSGRRELARAFVTEAAPLTARVIVNRIWQQHFGQGLVDTPSNFGAMGSPPSHPELLDDLAARFIAHGWSLKWLHREIVHSATYQQSSAHDEAKFAVDPYNRLLWRASRRRLEVEMWRDAMLATTDRLNRQLGGPDRSLDEADNDRRTIYATIKRRELHPMLRLLDFPDPTTHNATRDVTTTPLQQLFVLNSPFMLDQAAALAERVRRDVPDDLDAQVRRAYEILFLREPTARQLELAREFLAADAGNPSEIDARWKQYAQALLGSNEFTFVE
jgi:hypothetical protein